MPSPGDLVRLRNQPDSLGIVLETFDDDVGGGVEVFWSGDEHAMRFTWNEYIEVIQRSPGGDEQRDGGV